MLAKAAIVFFLPRRHVPTLVLTFMSTLTGEYTQVILPPNKKMNWILLL
jgi:hypothetical protein